MLIGAQVPNINSSVISKVDFRFAETIALKDYNSFYFLILLFITVKEILKVMNRNDVIALASCLPFIVFTVSIQEA